MLGDDLMSKRELAVDRHRAISEPRILQGFLAGLAVWRGTVSVKTRRIVCSREIDRHVLQTEFACRSRRPVTCPSLRRRMGRPSIILAFADETSIFVTRARISFGFIFFLIYLHHGAFQRALSKHDDQPADDALDAFALRADYISPSSSPSNPCSSLSLPLEKSAREFVIWREWDLRAKW